MRDEEVHDGVNDNLGTASVPEKWNLGNWEEVWIVLSSAQPCRKASRLSSGNATFQQGIPRFDKFHSRNRVSGKNFPDLYNTPSHTEL
jgi:hypothetical protein